MSDNVIDCIPQLSKLALSTSFTLKVADPKESKYTVTLLNSCILGGTVSLFNMFTTDVAVQELPSVIVTL